MSMDVIESAPSLCDQNTSDHIAAVYAALPSDGSIDEQITQLEAFLRQHPNNAHTSDAQRRLDTLSFEREEAIWSQAIALAEGPAQADALRTYLAEPNHQRFRERAERRLTAMVADLSAQEAAAADLQACIAPVMQPVA